MCSGKAYRTCRRQIVSSLSKPRPCVRVPHRIASHSIAPHAASLHLPQTCWLGCRRSCQSGPCPGKLPPASAERLLRYRPCRCKVGGSPVRLPTEVQSVPVGRRRVCFVSCEAAGSRQQYSRYLPYSKVRNCITRDEACDKELRKNGVSNYRGTVRQTSRHHVATREGDMASKAGESILLILLC